MTDVVYIRYTVQIIIVVIDYEKMLFLTDGLCQRTTQTEMYQFKKNEEFSMFQSKCILIFTS